MMPTLINRLITKDGPSINPDAYSTMMPKYKRVAIDFDGTINDCWSMEECPTLADAKPRDGALEGLRRLNRADIPIVIWTAHEPLDEVKTWLDAHNVTYADIRQKIPAVAYVDDHGINSKRDWTEITDRVIHAFYGKVKQPEDDWEGLEKLAAKAQPEMEELLKALNPARTVRLDDKLPLGELEAQLRQPGSVLVLPPPKGRKRAEEKVEDDYGGDWSKLLDINRASLAFDTRRDLEAAADILKKAGKVARPAKDRFAEPLGNGYRDYLVNYRLPCGSICEVQLHLKPMLIARERVKMAYDVARAVHASLDAEGRSDMTPAEAEAVRRARKAAKRMYAQAWQECLANEYKDTPRPTNRLKDISQTLRRIKDWKADDVMGLCQCGHDRDAHDGGVGTCLTCGCNDYQVVTNGVAEKGILDAGRWLSAQWISLEARYGRKTALAMAIGMLGTLAVPGSIPAIIAAAETIRGIRGYFQNDCGGSVEKALQLSQAPQPPYTAGPLNDWLRAGGAIQITTYARSTVYSSKNAGDFMDGRDGLYVRAGSGKNFLGAGGKLVGIRFGVPGGKSLTKGSKYGRSLEVGDTVKISESRMSRSEWRTITSIEPGTRPSYRKLAFSDGKTIQALNDSVYETKSLSYKSVKGETVMDLDPSLTLQFPINRLGKPEK